MRTTAALRAIRTRKALERSALWAEIGGEVRRVLEGVERGDCAPVPPAAAPAPRGRALRAVAWNIQRGARLDDLRRAVVAPPFAGADLLLLSEVDVGLGRSGNRNVARELAEALGMSYAFGVSYLALTDDFGDDAGGLENTLALSGAAILSRYPIRRVENVDLPELRDKFHSSEKRLGKKRALLAEIALPDGPLAVAACHLDSNASPAQRARQLGAVLDSVDRSGVARALVGGDFNTSTYDISSTLALARDILHKLLVIGLRATIDQYMTPEKRYERPVFELLQARDFVVEGFNDRGTGTYFYDLTDPYILDRVAEAGRPRAHAPPRAPPPPLGRLRARAPRLVRRPQRHPGGRRRGAPALPPPTDAPSPITRPSSSTSRSRFLRRSSPYTCAWNWSVPLPPFTDDLVFPQLGAAAHQPREPWFVVVAAAG